MNVLCTADWHLSDNPRDSYRFVFVEKTLPRLIKEHQVKCLVIAGDLTEAKDRHPARLTNAVVRALGNIARLVEIIVIRGNHDAIDIDHPFFQFLGRLEGEGIRWINQPKVIGDDLFLPHTTDYKRDWERFDFSEYRYIYAHNTFEGSLSEHGKQLSGIPISIFPKGVKVIAGDIHTPQNIGPVTYVGAPYRVDFGDDYEPRVLLLSPEGGRVSLPVEGPQKRLIDLTSITDLKKRHEAEPGDVVKVRMRLNLADRGKWWEWKQTIREWGTKNKLNIHTIQPVIERSDRKVSHVRLQTRKTDSQLLHEYVKSAGVDAKMLKIGLGILEA